MGVRQQNRYLLFSRPVEQTKSPRSRLQVGIKPPVQFCAASPPVPSHLRRSRLLVPNADVTVPFLEVQSHVPVQESNSRAAWCCYLPHCPGNQGTDTDVLPFLETVIDNSQESFFGSRYRKQFLGSAHLLNNFAPRQRSAVGHGNRSYRGFAIHF